jgi:hypothetical protein
VQKLRLLRDHLLASLPELAGDSSRLLTFIETGILRFVAGNNLSHEVRATARIVLLDYTGPMLGVTVPLLAWIANYQPDIRPDDVRFEAEILSNQAMDISILVPLTERVVVLKDCATGRLDAEPRVPEFARDACAQDTWQLWARAPGETDPSLISEWTAP